MKKISSNNVAYLIFTKWKKFNGKFLLSETYSKMCLYIFDFHHLSHIFSRLKFRRLHGVWLAGKESSDQ
jgi:hypothetical protein